MGMHQALWVLEEQGALQALWVLEEQGAPHALWVLEVVGALQSERTPQALALLALQTQLPGSRHPRYDFSGVAFSSRAQEL